MSRRSERYDHEHEIRKLIAEHPEVTAFIVETALRFKRSGKRASFKLIFELARTHFPGVTLDNRMPSHLVRVLMLGCPELRGYFQTRPIQRERDGIPRGWLVGT